MPLATEQETSTLLVRLTNRVSGLVIIKLFLLQLPPCPDSSRLSEGSGQPLRSPKQSRQRYFIYVRGGVPVFKKRNRRVFGDFWGEKHLIIQRGF